MEDIFVKRKNIPYDRLRWSSTNIPNNDGLLVPRANTTAHGIESMRYVGSRLWQ